MLLVSVRPTIYLPFRTANFPQMSIYPPFGTVNASNEEGVRAELVLGTPGFQSVDHGQFYRHDLQWSVSRLGTKSIYLPFCTESVCLHAVL